MGEIKREFNFIFLVYCPIYDLHGKLFKDIQQVEIFLICVVLFFIVCVVQYLEVVFIGHLHLHIQ